MVSGFFGVGGAFISPPLLTTFFGLRQLEAQGLALALVSPSAFIALLAYAGRSGRLACRITPCAWWMVGARQLVPSLFGFAVWKRGFRPEPFLDIAASPLDEVWYEGLAIERTRRIEIEPSIKQTEQ